MQEQPISTAPKWCGVCGKKIKPPKTMKCHVKGNEHKMVKRFGIKSVAGL